MSNVSIDVRGLPQTRRMLARYSDRELQNRERRAVRAGAKPFQTALKAAATSQPTGNVPDSFKKVPAAKVSTHGGPSGRDVEARVRPKSPLFNIFEPGAGAHQIGGGVEFQVRAGGQAGGSRRVRVRGGRRTSGMLSGPQGSGTWDEGGRKRPNAFFARGPVTHPGMTARPILPAAFGAGERPAVDAIARVLFEGD